ncbi:FAD-dependent oxidoreductase [Cryobacterium sp. PAMC25264]|uniref:FAD-dependent oxidoreductase n=1 Tax=Cryobacterium sp. PAMC25264 TaxID=2861288 RepID=UPI002107806A|nr:FAD-dependent oxidoreductase [Cryobacterium sp. PAMC25264]
MLDVIVIGGGVAGLVAARECAHLGLNVLVLEAADVVGGAVAGHEVAGLPLDAGAESFAVRGNTVAAFVANLGLADQIVEPNPAGAWLHLPPLRPAAPRCRCRCRRPGCSASPARRWPTMCAARSAGPAPCAPTPTG